MRVLLSCELFCRTFQNVSDLAHALLAEDGARRTVVRFMVHLDLDRLLTEASVLSTRDTIALLADGARNVTVVHNTCELALHHCRGQLRRLIIHKFQIVNV